MNLVRSPSILRREHVSLGMRLAYTGMAFLISVLLARLLGPPALGQYYEVVAWMLLFGSVVQSGWTPFLVREIAAMVQTDRWGPLLGIASLSVRIVAALAVAAALVLTGLAYVAYRASFSLFLIAAPIILLLSLSLIWQAIVRGIGWTLLSQLCETLVRPGVQLLGLFFIWIGLLQIELVPLSAVAILFVATGISALVAYGLKRRALAPFGAAAASEHPQSLGWLRSLGQNGLIAWCMAANPQIATVMLGAMSPDPEIADFRIALQISQLLPIGLIAVVSTYSNEFSGCFARGDMAGLQRLARTASNFSLIIALPVGLPFALFGESLIRMVFGHGYAGAAAPLLILLAGQVGNAFFGAVTAIAIATRSETAALRAHVLGSLSNLLLCFLLIPKFGAEGAATASTISLIVWNFLIYLYLRRRFGLSSFIGWSRAD